MLGEHARWITGAESGLSIPGIDQLPEDDFGPSRRLDHENDQAGASVRMSSLRWARALSAAVLAHSVCQV